MQDLAEHRFDRNELAGSLGDLGTLLPLTLALVLVNGVPMTTTLLGIGALYVACGFYYHLPIPVQPLKVVSAAAIAGGLSAEMVAASGVMLGAILLLLAVTGAIKQLARLFGKPIIRGLQLGLGLVLMQQGVKLIASPELFLQGPAITPWINPAVGVAGTVLVLVFLENRRFPAALMLLIPAIAAAALFGEAPTLDHGSDWVLLAPDWSLYGSAFILLTLPQLPLTLGNAILSTRDVAHVKFGAARAARVNDRALLTSMGSACVITGLVGAMPVCHGAGGLAAHYRFGARTGGSNLIIGGVFIAIALLFGENARNLLALIPAGILGVLLLFAGLELARLIVDLDEGEPLLIALLLAGVTVATGNAGLGMVAGLLAQGVFALKKRSSG